MKISSFFTGAGGLDLGFKNAGAQILYANEFDKKIWSTFELNFTKLSNTFLDKRSITDVAVSEVPDCDGIIGGPPCQSWSEAGAFSDLQTGITNIGSFSDSLTSGTRWYRVFAVNSNGTSIGSNVVSVTR